MGSTHIHPMTTLVTILLVLALVGVLAVLVFGVVTMLRGGNPRRSNKLMQMRVIMQGLALLLLAILMLLAKH
jgi:NADH:ubiquinone oxidoreductase subunit 6 (subunit J)